MPSTYLFNVQKVLGIEGDGRAGDRHILVQGATVAHVRLHGKGHRLGLGPKPWSEEGGRKTEEEFSY